MNVTGCVLNLDLLSMFFFTFLLYACALDSIMADAFRKRGKGELLYGRKAC